MAHVNAYIFSRFLLIIISNINLLGIFISFLKFVYASLALYFSIILEVHFHLVYESIFITFIFRCCCSSSPLSSSSISRCSSYTLLLLFILLLPRLILLLLILSMYRISMCAWDVDTQNGNQVMKGLEPLHESTWTSYTIFTTPRSEPDRLHTKATQEELKL